MDCDYERTFAEGRAGFADFLDEIETYLESRDVPPEVTAKAMIALDEVISNIISHGAAGAAPRIAVRLSTGRGELVVEVADDGIPFDPLAQLEPDTLLSVEDRPIGGLGIHIVRGLMDRIEYEHDGECNRLRFAKTYPI